MIFRDRTAIRRFTCSRPVLTSLSDGLVNRESTFLDFGCGYGKDVEYLKGRKFKASGWDPNLKPKGKIKPADIVNLGYVLNVIENPQERDETLKHAYSLANKVLVVAVRLENALENAVEFSDGVLTRRGTFQKIYTQEEFRNYIESVLNKKPQIAALGIAYVFKDEEAETQFLASRAFSRQLQFRTDLIEEFEKDRQAKQFVKLANKLGRVPLPREFSKYQDLLEKFGSDQRLARLVLYKIDKPAFEGSQAQRREDIFTFIAMFRLQGLTPPPFHRLPFTIQADIRGAWKNYKNALAEGEGFLFKLGKPEIIEDLCSKCSVGKLLPFHLYVHRSAEDELPCLLRILIFAAKQIVGEVPYEITKISLDGRSVSFLHYPDFDEDPHPALFGSIQVYLPKASFRIRAYKDFPNPPILHRKETFVLPTYPYHEKFRLLTQEEEALKLLSCPDIGNRNSWEELLKLRGIQIEDHCLKSHFSKK